MGKSTFLNKWRVEREGGHDVTNFIAGDSVLD